MTGLDWIAAGGFFLAFAFTLVRTEVLNPRNPLDPSAPYVERLAWDALAVAAGLRGWTVWTGVVDATGTEAAVAACLAVVAAIGMVKVLGRAFGPRAVNAVDRWLFGGW